MSIESNLHGWPNAPIPQYKFIPQKPLFPQIEFRYQAITIPETKKMPILTKEDIRRFTEELWLNAETKKGDFTQLSSEYLFIHLCLIYYFEDNCKGLNNLYRIWLLISKEKSNLNWKKIEKIVGRYHITSVFFFVLLLAKRTFSNRNGLIQNRILKIIGKQDFLETFLPFALLPHGVQP